jgi:hypothetical protein
MAVSNCVIQVLVAEAVSGDVSDMAVKIVVACKLSSPGGLARGRCSGREKASSIFKF